MKHITTIITLFLVLIMSIVFYQCTHDDPVIENPGGDSPGEALIDTEGTIWRFDKPHSNIRWETAYLGELALLTGRFTDYGIELLFDEKEPSNSTINAWVTITSNTTGESGRDIKNSDGSGGCMPVTLGVQWDTIVADPLELGDPIAETNIATFSSSNISRISTDEYLAKGFLDFNGVKSAVDLRFTFLGIWDRNGDGSDLRASFEGEFVFLAKSIHGVESGNIGDEVTIKVNCQTRLR